MTQLFVETEFGRFPVTEMYWSPYGGQLEMVVTTTPYDPKKERYKSYFLVERFGSENIINPDSTIDLVGTNNAKFKAKLIL